MKLKKICTSILIIMLVFLCFSSRVDASFFDKDDDTDIEKIIKDDERRPI